MATTTNNDSRKKIRDKEFAEAGVHRFERQKKALYLPNIVCFAVEGILFLILLIMDTPSVVFDDSSRLFAILLLINALVPFISLIVIFFVGAAAATLIYVFKWFNLGLIPLFAAIGCLLIAIAVLIFFIIWKHKLSKRRHLID